MNFYVQKRILEIIIQVISNNANTGSSVFFVLQNVIWTINLHYNASAITRL